MKPVAANALHCKFFRGIGADGMREVEHSIKVWLSSALDEVAIVKTDVQLCTIAGCPQEEFYQLLLVAVWYTHFADDDESLPGQQPVEQ